jgi:hypothetical protein
MQYSPKLKKAMQEIQDILSKHDIAGVVVIHTPGHTEYLNKLDPTYSCVTFTGDKLRFKSQLADYNGDKTAWKQKTADSVDMMHGISMTLGRLSLPLMDMSAELDSQLIIERGPSGHSSHTTQNN